MGGMEPSNFGSRGTTGSGGSALHTHRRALARLPGTALRHKPLNVEGGLAHDTPTVRRTASAAWSW